MPNTTNPLMAYKNENKFSWADLHFIIGAKLATIVRIANLKPEDYGTITIRNAKLIQNATNINFLDLYVSLPPSTPEAVA